MVVVVYEGWVVTASVSGFTNAITSTSSQSDTPPACFSVVSGTASPGQCRQAVASKSSTEDPAIIDGYIVEGNCDNLRAYVIFVCPCFCFLCLST